ncbi:MAG: threonine/serine dehydratase [Anaerolineales bacterium]|nr:threonine/serine dehydratase [Anaerolineales bacterium]
MDEPTIAEIRETRALVDPYVVSTPVWQWRGLDIEAVLGQETDVFLKLELFQQTGTFKARGAVRGMLALSPEKLARGVTAVSAGNHAIAVAYAANILGTTAKVVMFKSANPVRVEICRKYGAEIELMNNVHEAFARVHEIEAAEGRTFIHPFEGKPTILGTATVGLELCEAVPDLDAVIVPIGGGGLAAGVATAVKLLQPNCAVYGVEPTGADSMTRSFASGKPEPIDAVRTIADSLGAPYAMPYSFGLCQKYIDEIVLVDDDALRRAMLLLFKGMKLALEPAAAAATAALVGPLRQRLLGKRVGVIVCGTNTDAATFVQQITAVS